LFHLISLTHLLPYHILIIIIVFFIVNQQFVYYFDRMAFLLVFLFDLINFIFNLLSILFVIIILLYQQLLTHHVYPISISSINFILQ